MRRRCTLFCNALIASAAIAACQTALLSEQPRKVADDSLPDEIFRHC